MDKRNFNEALASLMELSVINGGTLTENDIHNAFLGIMEDEAQFAPIYQYLREKNITVVDGKNSNLEKRFLEMYKRELSELEKSGDFHPLLMQTIKGDADSRNRLIENFLPLVVKLAARYKNQGVRESDLIQEGNLGLIEGVDSFTGLYAKSAGNVGDVDDIKSEDFINHITQSIISGFTRAISDENNSANISGHLVNRVNAVSDATEAIAEKMGRQATLEELCEYLSLSEEEVREAIKISLSALSMEE